MALIVQKFGGSSVASIDKIQHVAKKIIDTRSQGHTLAVVVSAMGGETNRLISLAKALNGQPDAREYDLLLATGEQAATALLAMALLAQGCPARSYSGFHIPIYTDSHHKKARILNIEKKILQDDIAVGRVPVVAGFQGISVEGHMTTLGRGGSDTTAAALAAVLEADECQIYTDVDGVYTADPHIVSQAKRLDSIGFTEMTEFARAGAKVVQHRAVELANKYRVPLRVLSSFQKGNGTLVDFKENLGVEKANVIGVTSSCEEAKITLKGLCSKKDGLISFFSLFKDSQIEIDMLVQQVTSKTHMDVSFTLAQSDYQQVMHLLQTLVKTGKAHSIEGNPEVGKISVIGTGLHSHPEVMYTLFRALTMEEIAIFLVLSSALRVSLIVKESQVIRGVQALHQAFNLGKNSI